jgi:anti-sigma-K factor RskA
MDDCDRLKKYVSDYVEGQLDPSTRRLYEEELKTNTELQQLTEKVSKTSHLLKNLPTHKCSSEFNVRLRERIYHEPQKSLFSSNVRRYSLAFSLIIVVAVAIFAIRNQTEEKRSIPLVPLQNAVSSDNNSYDEESFDVKTRSQQSAVFDSSTNKIEEKKDPHIKYVDQKK